MLTCLRPLQAATAPSPMPPLPPDTTSGLWPWQQSDPPLPPKARAAAEAARAAEAAAEAVVAEARAAAEAAKAEAAEAIKVEKARAAKALRAAKAEAVAEAEAREADRQALREAQAAEAARRAKAASKAQAAVTKAEASAAQAEMRATAAERAAAAERARADAAVAAVKAMEEEQAKARAAEKAAAAHAAAIAEAAEVAAAAAATAAAEDALAPAVGQTTPSVVPMVPAVPSGSAHATMSTATSVAARRLQRSQQRSQNSPIAVLAPNSAATNTPGDPHGGNRPMPSPAPSSATSQLHALAQFAQSQISELEERLDTIEGTVPSLPQQQHDRPGGHSYPGQEQVPSIPWLRTSGVPTKHLTVYGQLCMHSHGRKLHVLLACAHDPARHTCCHSRVTMGGPTGTWPWTHTFSASRSLGTPAAHIRGHQHRLGRCHRPVLNTAYSSGDRSLEARGDDAGAARRAVPSAAAARAASGPRAEQLGRQRGCVPPHGRRVALLRAMPCRATRALTIIA